MSGDEAAGRHLADVDLSDLVDGRASEGAAEHLASCSDCGRRLTRMREASRMVGALAGAVPDDADARRTAAVAAAMSDSRRESFLARIGPRPAWLAAAAAAAIVVAGSIGGLELSGGMSGGGSHTVAGSASRSTAPSSGSPVAHAPAGSVGSSAAGAAGAAGSPGAVTSSGAAAVPPLGAVAGPQQLVADLKSRLGAVPAGVAPVASGTTNRAGSGTQASGSSDAAASRTSGDYASSSAPAGLSCVAAADALELLGPARTLLLQATLVYAGAPAQVFVYAARSQHVAVVMRPTTCQTLTTVSF